jgi:hypothetical protein
VEEISMRFVSFAASAFFVAALSGCDNNKPAPPPAGSGPSTFKGTVKVEFMNPEKPSDYFRDMKVIAPFGFIDSKGIHWDVPEGAITNGASVPVGTWNLVGGPFDGLYREAAVIHDYFVEQGLLGKGTRSVQDTNRVFYEAMRARGVSEDLAKVMYTAVQLFGPTWEVRAADAAMVKGGFIALPPSWTGAKPGTIETGATPPADPAPAAPDTPAPPPAPPAVTPPPAAETAAAPEAQPGPGSATVPSQVPGKARSLAPAEVNQLLGLQEWIMREKPSLEEIDKRVNEMRMKVGKQPVPKQ